MEKDLFQKQILNLRNKRFRKIKVEKSNKGVVKLAEKVDYVLPPVKVVNQKVENVLQKNKPSGCGGCRRKK